MRQLAALFGFLLLCWGCSPAPRYTVHRDDQESPGSAAVSGAQVSPSAPSGGVQASGKPPVGTKFRGIASFYSDQYQGKKTASGEVFDMYGLTAAHQQFPFDTWLEVRNLSNGRTVIVRVNDRGPFIEGRILDLSYGAAKEIDMILKGIQEVEITVIR